MIRRMARKSFIRGTSSTRFGKIEHSSTLELMSQATQGALEDAGVLAPEIDGLLCGYSTVLPHLMLSTLFAEYFALRPGFALSVQLGGATGCAMLALARELVSNARCSNVLLVAGENRLTGQSRDTTLQALAQVGDARSEVPCGASVPAYYALLASRYLHETGLSPRDLAAGAVLMRANASHHPGAHMRGALSVQDVMASRPIATPLKLLDCCPVSDGAAAIVVSATPGAGGAVAIAGTGQAHRHQHLSAIASVMDCGASSAAAAALREAKVERRDIGYLGIYDSYTVTLAMLLEQTGFAPRGRATAMLEAGEFASGAAWPLNTHGGLLSYGHPGVAGGLQNAIEAHLQLSLAAGDRQVEPPAHAFVHGEGGILSSHVSVVLSRT